jgi:hypothetical protein
MNNLIKKFKISDSQNLNKADNRKSSNENIKLEIISKRNSEIHEKFYETDFFSKNYIDKNEHLGKEEILSSKTDSMGNDEITKKFSALLNKINLGKESKSKSIIQSSNSNLLNFKIKHNNQNLKSIKRPMTESKPKIYEQSTQKNKMPLINVLSKNFFQTETNPSHIKEKSDSNIYKNILIKNTNSLNYKPDLNFNFNSKNFFNIYKIPKIKNELKDIYKLDRSFLENLHIAKSKKALPLKVYQDNLLKLFSERLSRYSIDKLNVRFKKIRAVSNSVKPTNSTNWNEVEKVLEKSKSRSNQVEVLLETIKNNKEKKNPDKNSSTIKLVNAVIHANKSNQY